MKIKILLLLYYLTTTFCVFAAKHKVYPTPQWMESKDQTISLQGPVQIVGLTEADGEAVKQLQQLLTAASGKKGYPIYIGEKGDRAIKKYYRQIPSVAGGYYLSISPERLVITGRDEQGTFYALQTLKQLWNNQTLPVVEIKDYPTVAYRGIVEGFYGQPWSHEARIRQLRFYGENKLNTYIYGPKDDPYHSSPDWRKPYPEREARQIRELVALSKANKVDFVWAIHPGQDIRWNQEDRQALLEKFEKMYELGIRSFAVFFDDIAGEGTDPERQAELLNYLHEHFVAVKKDVKPLIMCPTEYNKSWADPEPGSYLDVLGEKLHPSVLVMWTGDRVISDITSEGLEWVNKRIKRPAYIWWNFPVNDYVRDHLLMGPAYGLDTTAGTRMSGFVVNPMERAQASKIAIFSIADYAWNPARYHSDRSWQAALQHIMPHAPEAFRTFASHNADPGKNGHKYRREESVALQPAIRSFLKNYKERKIDETTFRQLQEEYKRIEQAPAQLRASADNLPLLEEISPWLAQFEILGKAGQKALELAGRDGRADLCSYWHTYRELLQLEQERRNIDKKYNQNPYQPGIKTGSLYMQPLIDSIRFISSKQLFHQHTDGQAAVSPAPIERYTNIKQLENIPLVSDTHLIALSPLLEVVRIAPGEYLGLKLAAPLREARVSVNLNSPDALKQGQLEISSDGQAWNKIAPRLQGKELSWNSGGQSFQYLRFINTSEQRQDMYLKKFQIRSMQLDSLQNSPSLIQDRNLETAYLLPGNSVVSVPNPSYQRAVTYHVFADPDADIKVTGENLQGKTKELGSFQGSCFYFHCPAGIRNLQLYSATSCLIYELLPE